MVHVEPILASLEEFQEYDSEWMLLRILNLTININKYNPLHAGWHIELSREIKMKKAIINVQFRQCVFCLVEGNRSTPGSK